MKSIYIVTALFFLTSCAIKPIKGVYGFEKNDSKFIFEFFDDKNCKWLNSGPHDAVGSECELEKVTDNLYQIYILEYRTRNRQEKVGTVEYVGENNVVRLCLDGANCIELPYIGKRS